MAEATKLPVKNEKSAAPAKSGEWAPFDSLRHEIDRLFDEFRPFDWRLPSTRSMFTFRMPKFGAADWAIAPAMDLVEKEKEYEISAELPGIDVNNVEIKLANNMLTIRRRPYHDTVAILRLSGRPEFASCVLWRDCLPVVSVGPREALDKEVVVVNFCLATFGCSMAIASILVRSGRSRAHAALSDGNQIRREMLGPPLMSIKFPGLQHE